MSVTNRSSDKNSGAGDPDLEFMHKLDSSWHPCHVSLCVTGVGLIIKYANADSGDIVLNVEEALKGLRMRSIPINGDDCIHIKDGDHILATEKLQTNCLFYDAVVEKALRVRHSKRSPCRCTFRIKWLHRELNEMPLIVTGSSVMKLATTSINEHPIICSFFKMLKNLKCYTSPLPKMENDIDQEMDLHELLEKQIAVISNSVDVSKQRLVKDFQLGVEFNNKGEIRCRTVAKPEVTKPIDSTTSRRTTRSSRKLQTEIKTPNPPPPPDYFIHEVPKTPLLNPLAARAAFASLMSKVPHEGKFSVRIDFMQSLNRPDISAPTSTSISYEPQTSATSFEISTQERAKGNKSSEVFNSRTSSISSAKKNLRSTSPPKAAKIARASISKDKKLVSPNSLSRVTRSGLRNVNQAQAVDAKSDFEECMSEINSLSTNRNDTVKSNNVVQNFCKGEKEDKELEDRLNASTGLTNSTMSGRLTRSKVIEGKRSETVEAVCLLEEHKFAESTWSSSIEGRGSASKGKVAGSVERRENVKNISSLKRNELRRSPRTCSQKN